MLGSKIIYIWWLGFRMLGLGYIGVDHRYVMAPDQLRGRQIVDNSLKVVLTVQPGNMMLSKSSSSIEASRAAVTSVPVDFL